jgi:hypothetical protein
MTAGGYLLWVFVITQGLSIHNYENVMEMFGKQCILKKNP